jgi:23S rRNA pseudouridine2605 synthase
MAQRWQKLKRPGRRPRRTTKRPPANAGPHPEGERLQKVLAAAGVGSRRQCEELITSGRIEVDRKVVKELGTRVTAAQEIRVDGQTVGQSKLVYYAVNKPRGVLSTNRDPGARPRVIDLVADSSARLFPVGRLDMYSEGLILVTNDGELADRLTHPRYGVTKTYRVQVVGTPTEEDLAKLRSGVHLAEGVAQVDRVEIKSQHGKSTILEMVLSEGRNREIRRILARTGHKVLQLVRLAVGPVRLGKLPSGTSRRLTGEELRLLWQTVGGKPTAGGTANAK